MILKYIFKVNKRRRRHQNNKRRQQTNGAAVCAVPYNSTTNNMYYIEYLFDVLQYHSVFRFSLLSYY